MCGGLYAQKRTVTTDKMCTHEIIVSFPALMLLLVMGDVFIVTVGELLRIIIKDKCKKDDDNDG